LICFIINSFYSKTILFCPGHLPGSPPPGRAWQSISTFPAAPPKIISIDTTFRKLKELCCAPIFWCDVPVCMIDRQLRPASHFGMGK
jgi:hypothetical protein